MDMGKPGKKDSMPRKRIQEILRYVHFCDIHPLIPQIKCGHIDHAASRGGS